MEELEQLYKKKGAPGMYVRIATKKSVTSEDITDGEVDTNANVHTFDQAMVLCQIDADLNVINHYIYYSNKSRGNVSIYIYGYGKTTGS